MLSASVLDLQCIQIVGNAVQLIKYLKEVIVTCIFCGTTAQPKSGLLQASVVTAYCTYLIWSGVSAEPYGTGQ